MCRVLSGSFFSDVHHDRSSFLLGSMLPITIVKRFLNRTTPSIPLPEDIDDDPAHSESWLLISQPNADPEAFPTSSATVACQTSALPQLYETARSNLEKTRPLHRAEALQPPSFKPKSKLPRLHYGGLQAPELDCFASSLTTVHTAPPTHSSDLQPNHYLPLLHFARLLPCYSEQLTKMNQMQREPHSSYATFSMKLDSHPNSIVKSITPHLLTNISIVSPIASALEDCLCMYRFGTTGPAGANVTHTHYWSWIICTPEITSNGKRIQNLQEPG